ncbi:ataxin-2-like isoform X3 [Cimex lectularius]|uniref:LsmAD domain-containing protein n=1 Tax=Cimex lectularius TaxID=79782 RepID=A0A8I6S7H5_CIMLE|nr:ataxin-2-like isoform X3 [Cimex lectularius]
MTVLSKMLDPEDPKHKRELLIKTRVPLSMLSKSVMLHNVVHCSEPKRFSLREDLKSRPASTFESGSPRSRPNERSLSLDGVYNNSYFMSSVASLVGNNVKIHTATACVYEGIFRTFSAQFEIVIEMAHKVDLNNPFLISPDTLVDKMIFKPQDIMKIEITDTDVDYATRDTFQTDTAISKFNGQVTEKELEPWDGSSSTSNLNDDFDLEGATSNGWDVNDMFRQNEQMYGVTSDFDQGLSAYTTPLQNKDSKDYKDAEAKATKIAYEIESNPHYKLRVDLENGDEEEKFAAVARPANADNNTSSEGVNKYVCPPKRKTLQTTKVVRTTSSVPQQTVQQQNQPQSQSQTQSQAPQTQPQSQQQPQPQQTQQSPTSPPQQQTQLSPTQQPQMQQSQPQQLQTQQQTQPSTTTQQTSSRQEQSQQSCNSGNKSSNSQSNYSHHGPPNSHSNARDRVNGVMESPKPQRTSTRHGRSFNNSDNRFSNANGSLSSSNSNNSNSSCNSQTNSIADNRNSGSHSHSNNYNNSLNASNTDSHHKKPPLPGNHSVEHSGPNHSNSNQRKTSRGREEQLNDLKKFGNDFKLQNDTDEAKKGNNDNEQTVNSRSSESNQEHQNSMRSMNNTNMSQEGNVKVIKSKLNPNAKEFIYNPNAKPFTPRTASTPNQSRPHTPQTPGYGPTVPPMPAVVVSTYVVSTAQSPYTQPPNQPNRFRKVQVGQPSQMQVAAATGQPLLTTAPMHTQFTVPYSPQPHITQQPFQQMVRMVAQQGGGMVPPVITTLNYPPEGSQAQMQYMGPGSMGPHSHHGHHPPHVHQAPNNASSPQATNSNNSSSGGGGGSGSGAANGSGVPPPQYPPAPAPSYSQPPPPPPQGPGGPHPPNAPPHHTFPIMCPILPPHPATHNPHHMMAAAAAQSSVQQYIHHHPHQHSTSGFHVNPRAVTFSLLPRSRQYCSSSSKVVDPFGWQLCLPIW